MELKGKKINFLGDSVTAGSGTSAPDKKYTALIEREYGAVCRNYGLGDTSVSRLKNADMSITRNKDFLSRVPEMDDDADIAIVFGGTNDFGHGDVPIGETCDRTPYTFYGALHCLYTALIEKYPSAVIAVFTPLHRINEDAPNGLNEGSGKGTLKEYVNIIREVAEYYSLPVLDLYKESGLQPKVPIIQQKYIPDGLHPNDDGNAILAHKIACFLEML